MLARGARNDRKLARAIGGSQAISELDDAHASDTAVHK
jgi:hypothetical protein